jgi:hypothetical protein
MTTKYQNVAAPYHPPAPSRIAQTLASAAALVVFAAGCGKAPPPPIVEVEGIVRLDGKPLKKVEVRFIPVIDYGPEYVARGVTDDSGHFRLKCKGQAGACAGENHVLVAEADIPVPLQRENAQLELARYFQALGERPIPPKYGNLAESPLTANVKADRKDYQFQLTR